MDEKRDVEVVARMVALKVYELVLQPVDAMEVPEIVGLVAKWVGGLEFESVVKRVAAWD